MNKLLLSFLLMLPLWAGAATYYIAPSGNDSTGDGTIISPWQSYPKAVSQLSAGDTLLVMPGAYWGTNNINYDPIYLAFTSGGTAEAPITIRSYCGGVTNRGFGFMFRAPYFVVSGLTWDGREGGSVSQAIILDSRQDGGSAAGPGSHHITITNCVFQYEATASTSPSDTGGLINEQTGYASSSDPLASSCSNHIINCAFNRCTNYTVLGTYGVGTVIEGNTIADCKFCDAFRPMGSNVVIRCNTITNLYSDGEGNHPDFVQVMGDNGNWAANILIERNYILNLHGAQLFDLSWQQGGAKPIEAGGLVQTNSGYWGITFRNNLVVGEIMQGSIDIPNVRVENNTFNGCISPGLQFTFYNLNNYDGSGNWLSRGSAFGSYAKNNIFANCTYSYALYMDAGADTNAAYLVLTNSDFNYGTANTQLHPVTGTALNFYSTNTWPDICMTPLAKSIFLGSGTNLTSIGLTNDYFGRARKATGAWDIGAISMPQADYYVSLDGSLTGTGSASDPFKTIAQGIAVTTAGKSLCIGPGDYGTYNATGDTGGTAGNYIRYFSWPPRTATLRSLRLNGPWHYVDSLVFSNYSGAQGVGNIDGAAHLIKPAAHNCIVTNCLYTHIPFVSADDVTFTTTGGNKINTSKGDFVAAGFVPLSTVYLGACGMTNPSYWFTNHDTSWMVASVSAHQMTVTNGVGGSFAADPGTYWAAIYSCPGDVPQGWVVVSMADESDKTPTAATNFLFINNEVRDWAGSGIGLKGAYNTVQGNTFTNVMFALVDMIGHDLTVCSNTFLNGRGPIYYTEGEQAQTIHPSGWWDFFIAQINSDAGVSGGYTTNYNVWFHHNWVQGLDNQLGAMSEYTTLPYTHTAAFTNNVFVGIKGAFSIGWDDVRWANNTMYRANPGSNPLVIGGREGNDPITNTVVVTNIFADCGLPTGDFAGYGTSPALMTQSTLDYNVTTGPETRGYPPPLTPEAHGVSGGDPVFLNSSDPLGPDGIPFTADDGLQVLPNSPAAGAGAYPVYQITTNIPVAHFRLASPSTWVEPIGEAYDPAWIAQKPWQRGHLIRPWDTVPMIGTNTTAVFDATYSISAINGATTNSGISQYVWTIDGANTTTTQPRFTNTFSSGGTKAVVLTVYNTAGNSASTVNYYALGGDAPTNPPSGTAPSITSQPQSQSITAGGNASFSVSATGDAPLAYQWRLNGAALANATLSSYTTNSVPLAANGSSYSVVVTNAAGSVTSSAAVLTVAAAPVAPSITSQPTGQNVQVGANVNFTVSATGTAPLSYQWQKNGSNLTGKTTSALSLSTVALSDAGTFRVGVTNAAGGVLSDGAVLSVSSLPQAPVITSQPQSQTVSQGGNATFSVTATGDTPLAYQWRFNGGNLSGSAGTGYTVSNAQSANAGAYSVVVSNSAGSVTSASAVLTVNVPTPPSGTGKRLLIKRERQ